MSIQYVKYAIVGNSAAGIGAAEAIRAVDPHGSMAIISKEPYHTYSRALIGHYLCGEISEDRLIYRPLDFYKKNKVMPILGREVVGLDIERKTLVLSNPEEEIGWEKLLVATGGKPIIPRIGGRELAYTFTTLEDARKLISAASDSERAVIVGGGLIGLQVAEGLRKLGMKVTIVELMNRVLAQVVDEETSRAVEGILRREGIELVLGTSASAIEGSNGRAKRVMLSDGTEIGADIVVISVGVSPNIDLVTGTSVRAGKGIIVDEHMMTSAPDVYAAGDVVEVWNKITGTRDPIPTWPNAYMGGRAAGLNMAGKEAIYDGTFALNSAVIYGFPVVSAGMVNPTSEDLRRCDILVRKGPDRSFYRKIVLRDGRIVGMVGYGKAVDRSGIIVGLMRKGADVRSFADKLLLEGGYPPSWFRPPQSSETMEDRFGLIVLPKELIFEFEGRGGWIDEGSG